MQSDSAEQHELRGCTGEGVLVARQRGRHAVRSRQHRPRCGPHGRLAELLPVLQVRAILLITISNADENLSDFSIFRSGVYEDTACSYAKFLIVYCTVY